MSGFDRLRARWSTSLLAQALAANFLPMLGATAAILVMVGLVLFRQVDAFENELRLRAQSLADSVAIQSELAVMVGDTAQLENIANAVRAVDGVLYVFIDGADGERLVSVTHDEWPKSDIPRSGGQTVPASVAPPFIEAVAPIRASAPEHLLDWEHEASDSVLGSISVGLSSETYRAMYQRSVASMIAVALLALFLTLTAQHRQLRKVLSPLKHLTAFANRVGQGDLTGRAPVVRKDEVGELATAFNDMVRELDKSRRELMDAVDAAHEASRLKGQFLANMSHEIRTPLNGVIGMTELALDSTTEPDTREQLTTALASAQTLLVVLNDILDLSKIEAGKLELDAAAFDLEAVMEQSMRTFAVHAYRKRLELVCDMPANVPRWVKGDPDRLRQVLTNLISNAVKFTHQGEVALSVECLSEISDVLTLRFSVRDTGIGIPPERQATIFEPFTQVDGSMTRQYGGTGLGLTICSRLVAMMGGAIAVRSHASAGSCFTFTASLKRAAAPEHASAPVTAPSLAGLRVLVVDDNSANRRILERTLASWGIDVTCVESGPAGIAAFAAAAAGGIPFRLVILDVMMPGMDGFETGRRLLAMSSGRPISLVMLSSGMAGGNAAARRSLAGARYIMKPVNRAELLQTLGSAVEPPVASLPDLPECRDTVAEMRALSILLAEDNRVNQKVLESMLRKAGHSVVIANDGVEAVAEHTRRQFDLILMDVQMPKLSGWEATRQIRTSESSTGVCTPIIALTAHALPDDRNACFEAGMDGYVSKPVTRAELLSAIANAVGARFSSRTDSATHEHGNGSGAT